MGDPFLDAANEIDKPAKAKKKAPLEPVFGDAFLSAADAVDKTFAAGKAVAKVAPKIALHYGAEAVGKTADFLGAVLSTPKAAIIKAISGNKTPVEFSSTASLDQFKELADRVDAESGQMAHPWPKGILNPAVADIVTDFPMASGLNLVGKKALLPAGRAIANFEKGGFRTRAALKGPLEFFKPGSSLPNNVRRSGLLYHGSDAEGAAAIERNGFLGGGAGDTWLTPDRKLAEEYAKRKGGKVFAVDRESIDKGFFHRDNRAPDGGPVPTDRIPIPKDYKVKVVKETVPLRDEFYRTLQEAEGKTDWRAFLRRKALEGGQSLSREAQDAITHAIETKTVGSLPDDLQGWANRVITENRNMIADRLKAGMARAELSGDKGYVARILTPTGRKGKTVPTPEGGVRPMSPYGEAFDQGPPALGTSLGKERTEAGRKLTTAEMFPNKGDVLPSIEGTLAKGAQNDRAVMHGRIIRDLDRKFGRDLMPGDTPIGSIQGVPKGFDEATKARLMKRGLPPELHEVVTRMNQTFQPEEWGKKSEYMQRMNDFFRKTALFSPGFLSRNMQNNVVQTMIFGNSNPLDIKKTWGEATALRLKMFKNRPLSAAETSDLKEMIQNGIISRGYIAKETGGGKFDVPFRGMRRLNTAAEDISRISFYKYLRGKGMSPYEAGNRVNQVLFNYSPTFQSRGFKMVRRHVMPFINWQANIPQLAVRTAIERPGSLGMVGAIRATLNSENSTPEAYSKLPPYMKDEMATAISKDTWLMPQGFGTSDVGGQIAALGEDVGAAKGLVGEIAKGGRGEFPKYGVDAKTAIGDQLASMSYPQWNLVYTAVAGHDPFTGQPIIGGDEWRKYLAGKVPALKIPTLIKEIAEKKPGWQGRLVSFIAGIKTYEKPTQGSLSTGVRK